ncbi:ATP-binding cassette domain-containing protein [Gordonia sp. X0973]|uniref:ATP-binding cassette domain-containing protein n=1 Tax=Gordonia sp. X0973 TaxID=2742602 RepID=UPI000F5473BB|nr:ATP-binding cassette domain-containing protein [Gordonia sp. X0973]QKT06774.1 ATP-binding cassette domain-containing protein [Gordonia sp. X0973]
MVTIAPDRLGIRADDLSKTYPGARGAPRLTALDGLSLRVQAGTIFGLLGPNGAGKSTTVKILATLSQADSGHAEVAGIDVGRHPERVRRAIGLVAQKAVADPMATGRENLVLAARLQGMGRTDARDRANELLQRFSLADAADRLVKGYSGGMARKLDVAIGLVHRPQVLFLDEPTTGLDPEARAEMWAELEAMAHIEQMTVLLTTHYLEEADRLASRLAIIDHGRVVAEGTPESLKSGLHGDSVTVELDAQVEPAGISRALAVMADLDGITGVTREGLVLRGRADAGARALPRVLTAFDETGIPVASATVARPSLDDVYLWHTGRSFAAAEGAL